ncbi:MAG: hypothetical protein AAF565_02860, partial [Pseudomonadota bacterium]
GCVLDQLFGCDQAPARVDVAAHPVENGRSFGPAHHVVGNIYAACLNNALRAALPDADDMVRRAETAPILDWMRSNIHARGRLVAAEKLIEDATGEPPTTEPLLGYLEHKFGALYSL